MSKFLSRFLDQEENSLKPALSLGCALVQHTHRLLARIHTPTPSPSSQEEGGKRKNKSPIRPFHRPIFAMVPSPLVSPRRLSGPYISGAISSAASPLRGSFNLSCRSPVRPTYDADARRSSSNSVAAGSPFLKPPSFLPARTDSPKASWTSPQGYEDYSSEDASLLSDESPTDQTWFLQPQTPGLSSPQSAFLQDEGKLGVISAINIIVGKTVGVGAYSVPSAIFAGVGSVGMTLLIWVIGSLISFCGLAVYLVSG